MPPRGSKVPAKPTSKLIAHNFLPMLTKPQEVVGSFIVMPGRKGPVSVEEVVLEIPFPKCVKTTTLSANGGSVLYDEATKVAKWTIGKLAVGKTATLSGTTESPL